MINKTYGSDHMFKLLRTFQVVYETRSFSQTARMLFMSQPAVSNQIKQLEHELDTTLFLRNGRKEMETTKQADLLYQRSLELLEDWQATVSAIASENNAGAACRIAASHTSGAYLLPPLVKELSIQFPELRLSIEIANSEHVLEKIRRHHIDFGFIEKPLTSSQAVRHALSEDELVIAGDPTGPWLIREATSGVYHYTKRYFEEHDLHPEQLIEVRSNQMIVALLKSGFGRSVLSELAVPAGIKSAYTGYQRNFYMLERKHLTSPLLQKAGKYLLRIASEK